MMPIMPVIVVNVDYFNRLLASDNPADVAVQLFKSGGWVFFVFVVLWGIFHFWLEARKEQYLSRKQKVLLAVDVPKDTEQSPKAVEFIFANLAGSLSHPDRIEKYWEGKQQKVYSLEIVSIGGYVQFYVQARVKYRDLIEAAIYAQYPDAEITEAEDYTKNAPKKFPAPGWKLFGMEFRLMKDNFYPIRTYLEFEDKVSGELKDPMASLLEGMAKLRTGEQLWLQILVRPMASGAWVKRGENLIKKLIGRHDVADQVTFRSELKKLPGSMIDAAMMADAQVKEETRKEVSMNLHLSPGEHLAVEGISKKISKEPLETKIRLVYVCPEEVYAKSRTISMVKGFFGQFTILDQNGLRPYGRVTTKTDYPWQTKKYFEYLSLFMLRTLDTRRNSILFAYRNRDMYIGAPPSILNIEELATIYHFPVVQVKAPLIKKTLSKRAEPPVQLPISSGGLYGEAGFAAPQSVFKGAGSAHATAVPPPRSVPGVSETASVAQGTAAPESSEERDSEVVAPESPPTNLPFIS